MAKCLPFYTPHVAAKPQPIRSVGNSRGSHREQETFMFSRFFPSSNGTHGSSPDVSKEKRAFFKEDHMKAIKHTLLLVTVAVAGLSFIGLGSAHAGVIISDTFSGTSGSYMNGRTPDTTDVPGTVWAANGSSKKGLPIFQAASLNLDFQ